jgi:hypothetical protein
MGSLFKKKKPQQAPPSTGGPTPEGLEHERFFPLLCQAGNDGNKYLEAGMPGRSQREFLKILWYLGGSGMVDQFILGKAYLGMMAVESLKPAEQNALLYLVKGPPPDGFGGPMQVVGGLFQPAHHCFKEQMLSDQDHQLFHDLVAHANGGPRPDLVMSPWDVGLAKQERFPVLDMSKMVVACVIERDAPPPLAPDLEGQELQVEVPGL